MSASHKCASWRRIRNEKSDVKGRLRSRFTSSVWIIDLGLWSWGQNSSDSVEEGVSKENTCFRYANDDPVDMMLELARVFGVISIICCGITLIVTWFSTCMPFTKRTLWFVVLLYCTTAVCESLKFLIFGAKIWYSKSNFSYRSKRWNYTLHNICGIVDSWAKLFYLG